MTTPPQLPNSPSPQPALWEPTQARAQPDRRKRFWTAASVVGVLLVAIVVLAVINARNLTHVREYQAVNAGQASEIAGLQNLSAAAPTTATETATERTTETATERTTETATETATETITETQLADSSADAVADDVTSQVPAPSSLPVKTQKLTGSGDDVVKIQAVESLAIVKFDCPDCSGNVTLTTDGAEGLLVNTIGSYSGTHFINVSDGSVTNQLTVTAEGSWTASIMDYTSASTALSGEGDTALFLTGAATSARIKNTGEGNFVVQVYSSSGTDLAVNEIGSYAGTVPMSFPCLVQITSEGAWSIQPK